MSGLYFRGKMAYAHGVRPSAAAASGHATSSRRRAACGRPTCPSRARSSRSLPPSMWPTDEPRYFEPLVTDARQLAAALPAHARVVLLGSIATSKYVEVLRDALGARLHFPADFIGRGDMSRGALMLRQRGQRRRAGIRHGVGDGGPAGPPAAAPGAAGCANRVDRSQVRVFSRSRPRLQSSARSRPMYAICPCTHSPASSSLRAPFLSPRSRPPARSCCPAWAATRIRFRRPAPRRRSSSTRGSRCSTTSTTPRPSGRS